MKRIVIIPVLLISIICYSSPKPSSKAKLPQLGKASYYSDHYTGKLTANAERYNPKLFTAAHETLPLGTLVRVTNLSNKKMAIVKINDRCACSRSGRILDLSKSAAEELDFISEGIAKVKIEINR